MQDKFVFRFTIDADSGFVVSESYAGAAAIIEDFYGKKFVDNMQLSKCDEFGLIFDNKIMEIYEKEGII